MNIIQSICTQSPCYTAGKKITVKGLMLHSVGCPQPKAKAFINQWNSPTYTRACVHGIIDGNTGDVYQCLPWNHRGWHGGGSSNNTHIGIEMCEPACIEYISGSAFTCSDIATAKAVAKRTYDAAVQLFAYLCKQYNLNPLADGVIISHKEGHKRGVASNHGDPEHLWEGLGLNYTMDTFRKAVSQEINAGKDDKNMFYVQIPFAKKTDAETVKNAFKVMGIECAIVNDEPTEPKKEVTFSPGDKVRMTNGAPVYGDSKTFSAWVYDSTLYVRDISGDRVVISTQKTGAITGAVDKKYLTKI